MPYQKPEVMLLGPAQELILGSKRGLTEGFPVLRPQGPSWSPDSELDD
jgi:hypothetical protein